ncbi:MAG: TolC family protein [Thermoguttaceae bacterium]
MGKRNWNFAIFCTLLVLAVPVVTRAQEIWRILLPEQRRMEIRDPSMLSKARLPDVPSPPTVSDPQPDAEVHHLSLDQAIATTLANSEVIRVLGGSSGRTIYDPAITNTTIDEARAVFDPNFQVRNDFFRRTPPVAFADPDDPSRTLIGGLRSDSYNMGLGLSKRTVTGGTAALDVNAARSLRATDGLPLNPEISSSVDLSFIQPLLQGGGARASLAPILIARIDTERSFFQMKDAAQEMVRGVIQAYWDLVAARTDLWARRQQVEQGEEGFEFARVKAQVGFLDAADVAQARSALAGFRASLISAEATVLQREATLRNILGLPPSDGTRIVPVTPPTMERLKADWDYIVAVAAQQRPDLIELKLIIEADQQRLLLAQNQALPRVDATALYRWDGLEGRTPDRSYVISRPGQFTGWQLGVNFSVPLGLRQSRAGLRRQELVIMRDRANLDQGLHNTTHILANNYRNLATFYEQYVAFQEARAAAEENLDVQTAEFRADRVIYLNVLQAITNWGNAVASEAQSLTLYNTELANLARQTGTILEAHGIRLAEERYGSIGPLGRIFADRCYPKDFRLGPNADQYPTSSEPAEEAFDLNEPASRFLDPKPEGQPGR